MKTNVKVTLSLLGGACVAAAGAVIAIVALDGPAPGSAHRASPYAVGGPRSSTVSVEALQAELAALKRQVAKLPAEGSRRPSNALADELAALRRQVAVLQGDGGAEAGDPLAAAEAERERQVQIVKTEGAFRREGLDSRWADTASTALLEALTSVENEPFDVRGLECRAQTCRLEIASPPDADEQPLALALHQVGAVLPNAIATHADQPDGGRHTIIYLTRETPSAPTRR